MRRGIIAILTLVLWGVLIHPQPALARFDDRDARRLCKRNILNQSAFYRDLYDVTVRKKKPKRYKVRGTIRVHPGKDVTFVCQVEHRRIIKVKIADPPHSSSSASDADLAASAIAAIIGSAIVGAISDDHKYYHHKSEPGYGAGSDFRKSWGRSFSPHPGITCFPGQRACYKDGRGYSAQWTRKVYR